MTETTEDVVKNMFRRLLVEERDAELVHDVAVKLSDKLRAHSITPAELTGTFFATLDEASPGQQENMLLDAYAEGLELALEIMSPEDEENVTKIIMDMFTRVQGTEKLLKLLEQLAEQGHVLFPAFAKTLQAMQKVTRISFRAPGFINTLFSIMMVVLKNPFKPEEPITLRDVLVPILECFIGVRDPGLMFQFITILGKFLYVIGPNITPTEVAQAGGILASYFPITYHPPAGSTSLTSEMLRNAHVLASFSNITLLDDMVNMTLDSLFDSGRVETFRDGCYYLTKAMYIKDEMFNGMTNINEANIENGKNSESLNFLQLPINEEGFVNIQEYIDNIKLTENSIFGETASIAPLGDTTAIDIWNCLAASACEKGSLIKEAKTLIRTLLEADQEMGLKREAATYIVREFQFDSGNATVRAGIGKLIGVLSEIEGLPLLMKESVAYCVNSLESNRWFDYVTLSCALVNGLSIDKALDEETKQILQALINHLVDRKGAGWKMKKLTKAIRRICSKDLKGSPLKLPQGLIKRLVSNRNEDELSLLRALQKASPEEYKLALERDRYRDEEINGGDTEYILDKEEQELYDIYLSSSLNSIKEYVEKLKAESSDDKWILPYNTLKMLIQAILMQINECTMSWGELEINLPDENTIQELLLLFLQSPSDASIEIKLDAVRELLYGYLKMLISREGNSEEAITRVVGVFAYNLGKKVATQYGKCINSTWNEIQITAMNLMCYNKNSTTPYVQGLLENPTEIIPIIIDNISKDLQEHTVLEMPKNTNPLFLLPLLCIGFDNAKLYLSETIIKLFEKCLSNIETFVWGTQQNDASDELIKTNLNYARTACVLTAALVLSYPSTQCALTCIDNFKRLLSLNDGYVNNILDETAAYLDNVSMSDNFVKKVSNQALFTLLMNVVAYSTTTRGTPKKHTIRKLLNSLIVKTSQRDLIRLDNQDITNSINSLAKLGKKQSNKNDKGTGPGLVKLITLPSNPAANSLKEILCIFIPIIYKLRDDNRWEELGGYMELLTILSSDSFPLENRLYMKQAVLDCLWPCLDAPTRMLRDKVRKARLSWYLL